MSSAGSNPVLSVLAFLDISVLCRFLPLIALKCRVFKDLRYKVDETCFQPIPLYEPPCRAMHCRIYCRFCTPEYPCFSGLFAQFRQFYTVDYTAETVPPILRAVLKGFMLCYLIIILFTHTFVVFQHNFGAMPKPFSNSRDAV